MQHALLIRADNEEMRRQPPETFAQIVERADSFDARLTTEGRHTGSVRPGNEDVRVLPVRGGKPFVTDAPFGESKEQLGGLYLIEADDVEHATVTARSS